MSDPVKHNRYVRYVGHLYPDGSVTLIWVWRGEMRSIHYEPSALPLTINNEEIHWLVEMAL